MSTIQGMKRKRSSEDSDPFHLHEASPKAPKFLENKGNAVAAQKEKEVSRKQDDDSERLDVQYALFPENELEIHLGCYWDFLCDWPYFSTVEEQMLLGGFPFIEGGFDAFYDPNEVLWDGDLWQLKDIREIPNQ